VPRLVSEPYPNSILTLGGELDLIDVTLVALGGKKFGSKHFGAGPAYDLVITAIYGRLPLLLPRQVPAHVEVVDPVPAVASRHAYVLGRIRGDVVHLDRDRLASPVRVVAGVVLGADEDVVRALVEGGGQGVEDDRGGALAGARLEPQRYPRRERAGIRGLCDLNAVHPHLDQAHAATGVVGRDVDLLGSRMPAACGQRSAVGE